MDNDWQTRQVIKPVSGLKHQNANDEEYWWYGGMVALKLSAAVSCWLNTQKNKLVGFLMLVYQLIFGQCMFLKAEKDFIFVSLFQSVWKVIQWFSARLP